LSNPTKVRFVVSKSGAFPASLVATSGKVIVTRGGTDYEFDNLTVTETPTSFVLDFDAIAQVSIGNELQDLDDIRLSLRIKANVNETQAVPALKQLEVASYLIGDNDELLQCNAKEYTKVTGLYISREHSFAGNAISFADCVNDTNAAVFSITL